MLKRHLRTISFSILTSLTLGGCGGTDQQSSPPSLLPISAIARHNNLDDGYVKSAMAEYIEFSEAPRFSRYDFTRVDLNDDGLMDALVHMKAPYGHWCNPNGCTVIVLLAHHTSFQIAGNISPVRAPLYLANTKTHGLRDIITHHSGGIGNARNIKLEYDGRTYPHDPLEVQTNAFIDRSQLQEIFP